MKNLFISSFLIFLLLGCSLSKTEKSESFTAGFKTIRSVDRSRLYKPGTDTTDSLHFRPVDIDIWYPSSALVSDSALYFRYFLSLLEKRAVYYTGSQSWKGITSQVAQSFCEGYKCSDTAKLLNYITRSTGNSAVSKKFPLVIYLCGYNGMGFENFRLFEELAEKGYVVLSVSSIGRFPGDMTMKKEDLLEQVYDAEYSLKMVSSMTDIDFSRTGIIGYSWGGLAGSVLAGRIPGVECIISLDGSEFHHYGESAQENNDFDTIKASSDFRDLKLSIPYLRLESSPFNTDEKTDSLYNFTDNLTGEKQFFKIDSAQHQDFSCLSLIVPESGKCESNHVFETTVKLIVPFLNEYLKNKGGFSEAVTENSETVHRVSH